jgi:hypothetical protein
MRVKTAVAGRVYQMKITLKAIRPPIWRRVQVPGTIQLAGLHEVIQTVFGWTDTHLHQFLITGESYGRPDDFDDDVFAEATVTLAQVVGGSKRFTYTYDFGDNWEHEIVVEKMIAGNSGSERPLCLGGKRHRPPEDCGGPPGYRKFLEATRHPRHEEHEAMRDLVGDEFDPEAFDLAAVNRALAALPPRHWRVQ